MRLLPKDDIAKAQAKDRAREVSQGISLSRKVDGLRRLAADEEASLESWRAQTLAAIQAEIGSASSERERLLSEVSAIRSEISAGTAATEAKASELAEFEVILREREDWLAEREQGIDAKAKTAAKNLFDSADELARARSRIEESSRLHEGAARDRKEAMETLAFARKERESASESRKSTENDLAQAALRLSEREKAASDLEGRLAEEQSDIRVLKAQLEDQRKTLERAMERVNQQQNGK